MLSPPPRIAVIGAGIAGLAAADALHGVARVTLFEAEPYFGGHTHTVDVTLPDALGKPVTFGVDTGFLVLNERTYPQLLALFGRLGVPLAKSDMSFSVQVPQARADGSTLTWSGAHISGLFAQRRNLVDLRFWRMLADIVRFNRVATRLAKRLTSAEPAVLNDATLQQPLGAFLREQGFSQAFCDWYLLPMLGSIWSCPTDQMLAFPLASMLRFCHNHGLLQITGRPQWYTVAGGARQYVTKLLEHQADARLATLVLRIARDAEGVDVHSAGPTGPMQERFDAVVLASHSDQALALLGQGASPAERDVLGAIRYQPNRAVLHTDVSLLPSESVAWAAWNYERAAQAKYESAQVCLHYWLNRLQPLPVPQPVIVSMNPRREPAPSTVLGSFDYAHPVFDLNAIKAQAQVPSLQGQQRTFFAGAWMGYGFHEDGLKAGLQAAQKLKELFRLPGTQAHSPVSAFSSPSLASPTGVQR